MIKILVKMVNQDPFIADKFFYKNHPYGRVIDEENLVSVEDYFASKKTTLSKQESKEFEFEKKINVFYIYWIKCRQCGNPCHD